MRVVCTVRPNAALAGRLRTDEIARTRDNAKTRAVAKMRRARLILACGACLALMLGSCGKSQEPPGRGAQTLGETSDGAPIAPPYSDSGILQDQLQYRPASFTGGGAPGSRESAAAAGAEATHAVRELVVNLLNDLESGEVGYVLDAFDPEQIEPLRADDEFLWNTQEAYAFVTRALAAKFGDLSVEQLNRDLRKLVTEALRIDTVNADTATVTPNPLLIVLGPESVKPAMTVARTAGEWKIRLEAALSADDVARIIQYHKALQEKLYEIGDSLDEGRIEDPQAVYAALLQAGLGQELPDADEEDSEEYIEVDGVKIPKGEVKIVP